MLFLGGGLRTGNKIAARETRDDVRAYAYSSSGLRAVVLLDIAEGVNEKRPYRTVLYSTNGRNGSYQINLNLINLNLNLNLNLN